MKKKIIALILCTGMVMTLAGCNSSSSETDADSSTSSESTAENEINEYIETTLVEYTASDYVELGDYSSFDVTLDDDYKVTEKDVKKQVEETIKDVPDYLYTDKETTEDGDIVNINLDLTVDGESMDNDSLQEANIVLGENYMQIDGFDEELEGQKVGSVVEFTLDFPDDYGIESYQGKEGGFTVTINGIMEEQEMTYDTLTDHYVYNTFDYDTVEDYLAEVKTELQAVQDSQKESAIQAAVLDQIESRSTINGAPEGLKELRIAEYKNYYIYKANQAGQTISDYLAQYDLDEDTWDEHLDSYMDTMINHELVYMAIAEKEGIEASGENYDAYISGMMNTEGFTDETEFYEVFPEDYCQLLFCEQTVLDQLVENAKVTTK